MAHIKPPVQRTAAKKNIFISYRVSDTAGETGRLVDSLKQQFYDDQIFMDIDKIEPGVDFTEVISNSLSSCDVMLVVIGPGWLGPLANGSKRINSENDWVRLEVSKALERGIRVVPVLVDGAELPSAEELPEDLHPLLKRQSYEISNKRWKYDTEQLIQFLQRSIGIAPRYVRPNPVVNKPSSGTSPLVWVFAGVGILALIIIIAALMFEEDKPTINPVQPQSVVNNLGEQAVVDEEESVSAIANVNVQGTWDDPKDGGFFNFYQTDNQLSVQAYSNAGILFAEGTGFVQGQMVQFTLNTALGSLLINANASADGSVLSGDLKVSENGATYTEQVSFNRRR